MEQILQSAAAPPESHALLSGPGTAASAAAVGSAGVAIQQFADLQVGYNLQRRTQITLEAMNALSRILGGLRGPQECGMADGVPAI